MTIEIGRLVVQGQFGDNEPSEPSGDALKAALEEMREEILQEVTDLLDEQQKRARDR